MTLSDKNMAVGMLKTCSTCGKTYDSGRGSHLFSCDKGKALNEAEDNLNKFNQLSLDDRLTVIYKRLLKLEKEIDRMPYDGMIG